MDLDFATIYALPAAYWLSMMALMLLSAEALFRLRDSWSLPALMVYFTVFGWYMMEPINSPETMAFGDEELSTAYLTVFFFLAAFRGLVTVLAKMFAAKKDVQGLSVDAIPAEKLFLVIGGLWLVLLSFGTWRMDGNLFATLLPLDSRAGVSMWQRAAGADAGSLGFLVSMAAYLYTLVLAMFGMLLPLMKRPLFRVLCVVAILISWPYIFLQGSRNLTLAVFVPMVFSFVFFTKAKMWIKGSSLLAAALFVNWALKEIITFRNYGFNYSGDIEQEKHLGLNMASELIYCTTFVKTGVVSLAWGMNTMAELANVVPRALWVNKPLIGIDYAIARGFAGGASDTGVFATISTGMIGQGVLEFGNILGPLYSALLMAIWAAWLARLREQKSLTRTCLFLVGMGLTFNLGRNITLLVLWPMVFGFMLVLGLEFYFRHRTAASKAAGQANLPTGIIMGTEPGQVSS
ncbi:hypothetical protein [Sphingomonas immobilis]|uniref:Oligosaccharide repeat unit polymerase n=1 Tax=Sphingomonas immobilis TaxID=3063997 RepID=A0ABT8ZTN2_9SPHN|nr:hypothetical protein [Sphingomonas sp. CA1-15]MDO7840928.1 hypothetical protein [Sphingomonas sp. CA1-15]